MNVSVQTAKQDDVPICFGTHHWNPNEPECKGGADPKYTHPGNGSHVREICDHFRECGARSTAARMSTNIVPASQLTRPQAPSFPIVPPVPRQQDATTFREHMQRYQQQLAQTPAPQYPYSAHPPAPAMQYQYPAPTYQLQYLVPSYLSVPEQRVYGGSLWGHLGRELLRAALKATGHTLAAYFDTHPFRSPPLPVPPGGPDQK